MKTRSLICAFIIIIIRDAANQDACFTMLGLCFSSCLQLLFAFMIDCRPRWRRRPERTERRFKRG